MMEIVKSVKEQLIEERRKNEILNAQLAQINANLDFVAMMADVEIEDEKENNAEVEIDE